MSQPLIVSIPHRLGRQEARRRVDHGITRLRPELGILLSGLNYHWEQDTLNFIGSAMWQRISGRIEVLDDAVRVEIDLPWMMQLLRDTITRRVRGRGIALLEKPPGDASRDPRKMIDVPAASRRPGHTAKPGNFCEPAVRH
jgi:Putative polyhydroxyalkanoic acid system protein (PHA_gran_rgn)